MSPSASSFRRLDAGSRTVEGNVSGSRAAALERKRLQDEQDFELQKRQRLASTSNVTSLSSNFRPATKASVAEQAFSNQTVGLVSIDEFVAAAAASKKTQPPSSLDPSSTPGGGKEEVPAESEEARKKREKAERKARKKKLKEKKKQLSTLSFAGAEDEAQDEEAAESLASAATTLKKDPTVDTSFLPDPQRDEQQKLERQRLEEEWKQQQAAMKQEKLEITYSYWDGSGHRRSLVCQKGDSIGHFLQTALTTQLAREFRTLQNASSDDLLYVKEDLILPHDVTFYDLIATHARGKSGPLYSFDVHDDVRLGPIDSRVEKDESHPGKVVERSWYERNKHIFPASRWQVYDPTLESYGTYKIGGK